MTAVSAGAGSVYATAGAEHTYHSIDNNHIYHTLDPGPNVFHLQFHPSPAGGAAAASGVLTTPAGNTGNDVISLPLHSTPHHDLTVHSRNGRTLTQIQPHMSVAASSSGSGVINRSTANIHTPSNSTCSAKRLLSG